MPELDNAEDRSELIEYLKQHPEEFQLNLQFLEARPRISAQNQQAHRMINLPPYQNNEAIISRYHKKISRVLT